MFNTTGDGTRTPAMFTTRFEDVCHVEVVEFVRYQQQEGLITMRVEILGTFMHVFLILVATDVTGKQIPQGAEAAKAYQRLLPGGPFHTTELNDRPGEWVLHMVPFDQ